MSNIKWIVELRKYNSSNIGYYSVDSQLDAYALCRHFGILDPNTEKKYGFYVYQQGRRDYKLRKDVIRRRINWYAKTTQHCPLYEIIDEKEAVNLPALTQAATTQVDQPDSSVKTEGVKIIFRLPRVAQNNGVETV